MDFDAELDVTSPSSFYGTIATKSSAAAAPESPSRTARCSMWVRSLGASDEEDDDEAFRPSDKEAFQSGRGKSTAIRVLRVHMSVRIYKCLNQFTREEEEA
jgi:hypothetical protein